MSYTLCIAWELDLAEVLQAIDADRVRGLVAMMPAWSSPTGQWFSRPVTEVWLDSDETGRFMTFTDAFGEKFDGGIRGNPPKAGAASELLLRLPPVKTRALRPRSQRTDQVWRRAARAQK